MDGRIKGTWGALDRFVQRFAFADVLGLLSYPPGVWVRLGLRTRDGKADVEFIGSSWLNRGRELMVQRMEPNPAPWLRDFLTKAGRTLDSHDAGIPTPDVAWRVARLRLVLGQHDGVTDAVRQGLDHLRGAGTVDLDVQDLRLLHLQLSRCGCTTAAGLLSAYLNETVRS